MIVKYFVYETVPKNEWGDVKKLLTEWSKFEKRSNPRVYKTIRDAMKSIPDWNIPYKDKLEKIWSVDPNEALKVWLEVWPNPPGEQITPEEAHQIGKSIVEADKK
jgi:hypothetical protein